MKHPTPWSDAVHLSEYSRECLREDGEFRLYRARTDHNELPSVLLLAPVSTRPGPDTIEKLDHEYSLRTQLDREWAARPLDLSEQNGQLTLVIEDPAGVTLDGLISPAMDLTEFLRYAVGLAAAISGLHRAKLIHKDVKPTNILVDSSTGNVRLMGFGIASRVPREHQAPEPPELIAGTLPYMAPEQTGRMNRSIDSRADLYALGVTLYEMLTGKLPFTASDPLEWVHCHVAKHPVPPHVLLPSVPACVSAIVMKLLAKTAEERYQTASGVVSDLQRCLADLRTHGRIAHFSPGEHDAPDRLLIPEKLYGRARDIETLLAAFDRVVAGGRPELVLVSGYSGVGKSAVVNELHKPLVPPRGLFASGKFDQYKRNIPYATLAQAFQSLVRPILASNEEEVQKWRGALMEALNPNGQLMDGLIPELKAIIGEQPQVPDLPPQDAQRRLHVIFRRFISVFARPEHPLALFLDDLQWLDAATLDLVEELLTHSDVTNLMLIGAYRDNEVDAAHPLLRKLEAIRQAGVPIRDIVLAPLTREDLRQLLADSIRCQPEHARPLAELVHEKTSGNPFFTIQFLSELFDEGLLSFDTVERHWSWDLNRIKIKGYTANVVDLMVSKLGRLPPGTQDALKQLACLGDSADFVTLAKVYEGAMEKMHAELEQAVMARLILRASASYRFLHDRVREAAYSLIPAEDRAAVHLRIGRLMASDAPEALEEDIFEIVNQLNRAFHLITSTAERERVAELNLIAGRRAKTSSAYASARKYLECGRGLLTNETWNNNHELAFSVDLLLAECELLTTDTVTAENRLSMLADQAKGAHEIALVTRLRLTLYTALGRSDRAVEVFLDYWRQRGTNWSPHPTEEVAQSEYEHIWSLLGNRSIEELAHLPLTTDPDMLDALEVFTEIITPALFTDGKLFALVTCRMVSLSLEYGNSDASCYAYLWLGVLAGPHFGDYQAGVRFGTLACDLVSKSALHRYENRIYPVFAALITPWTQHVKIGREAVRRCFNASNRIGDFTYAAYSLNVLNTNLLAAGDRLADVQREAETGLDFATRIRFGHVIDCIASQLCLIRTLRGLTPTFGTFDDADFNELQFQHHLGSSRALAMPECWYWIRKLQARFLAGDYRSAIEASLNAERLLWTSPSFFEVAEYHFYAGLSRAASFHSVADPAKQQHLHALIAHKKQHEIWAANCPENFENRAALIAAEVARIEGHVLEAEQLYEQAIRSAHNNGFVNNEAIAYELAARFYGARGFQKIADAYLLEARYCYQRWGADGKVVQLDRLYPQLKMENVSSRPAATIMARAEVLDLSTVMRLSQAVSGEMVLQELIDNLMRAAIEHAGAERGVLILARGDQLLIEAEATAGGADITVHQRDASVGAALFPQTVVRYVLRTRSHAIVDDASLENEFSSDPYFHQRHVRAVLCLPLINQTKITGVLYLENMLASKVFTPDRIDVLMLLASRAAISLENAHLYADLRQAEAYLSEAQRLSRTGSVGWHPSTGELIWSRETYRIFEYDPSTRPTTQMVVERVHPEDRILVQQMIERAASTAEDWDLDHRLLMPDGSVKHLHVAAHAVEDDANGELTFVGAIMDVTAAKESQQALEKAFSEIKALKDQLQSENIVLREEIDRTSMFEQIVGTSPPLRKVLSRIAKVAPTESSVLITGETGTGKELVARAIHRRSRRSARAFVSVNCAATPRDLIASELFGHEKGAFTGATQRRLGRFELAEGGTIFLDEVGELPPETQVALLRVLQEREFERIGAAASIRSDVRVIAATNRDLEAAIAAGTFRSDLFYRLNVFPVEVPSLRERREDIPLLVEYFIDRFARQAGKSFQAVDKKSLELLQAYPWPGNIRELQNVIERSVIVCETDKFSVDESWLARQRPGAPANAASEPLRKLPAQEKELIEAALRECEGRVYGPSGAAVRLGIPRSTLEHKIRALRINKNQFRPTGF